MNLYLIIVLCYESDMGEIEHYPSLALCLDGAISANLSNRNIRVKTLYLSVFGNNLRACLDKYVSESDGATSSKLVTFTRDAPEIRTDLFVVLDNPQTNRFFIVIIEAKYTNAVGLKELSQLLGYCLVAKAGYGLLINIDGGVSNELSRIITTDSAITNIQRQISDDEIAVTKVGIMTFRANSNILEYHSGACVQSIPTMVNELEQRLG